MKQYSKDRRDYENNILRAFFFYVLLIRQRAIVIIAMRKRLNISSFIILLPFADFDFVSLLYHIFTFISFGKEYAESCCFGK